MTTDNDKKLAKAFKNILEARNQIRDILDQDELSNTEYSKDFIDDLKFHNKALTETLSMLKSFNWSAD